MTANEKSKLQVTLPSDEEILMTRRFDAPRDLVWQMWTQAEHLSQWWGPTGWTVPVCEVDLRPGGTWFYCMQSPEGERYYGKAEYDEIDVPSRLVYRDFFTDENGQAAEGMPVAHVSVEFIEEDGHTMLKSTTHYPTKADRDKVIEMGVEEGMAMSLSRLEALLPQ